MHLWKTDVKHYMYAPWKTDVKHYMYAPVATKFEVNFIFKVKVKVTRSLT